MLNVIALIAPPDKYLYHLTLFLGLTRLASDYLWYQSRPSCPASSICRRLDQKNPRITIVKPIQEIQLDRGNALNFL